MSSTLDRSRQYYLHAADNGNIRQELVEKYSAVEGRAAKGRLSQSQLRHRRMLIGVLRKTGNGDRVWSKEDRHEARREERTVNRMAAEEHAGTKHPERADVRSNEELPKTRIDAADAAVEKRTILLSSKLVGGREIWEAIAEAGVEVEEFCDALERVDAFELALEIRQARGEGRRTKDEFPPVLLQFLGLLKRLNQSPAAIFLYRIEFVFRAEDKKAKACLTQPQLWYELGCSDVTNEKEYSPPSKEVSDPRMRAYQDGYMGRYRTRYFPELAGQKQSVEETNKVITLKRNATLQELWSAWPGGRSALFERLLQTKVSYERGRDIVCNPQHKDLFVMEAFPQTLFSDCWFLDILGVEFEEEMGQ